MFFTYYLVSVHEGQFFFFPQCFAYLFRSPSLIRQNLRYKEFFHFFYAHLSIQHVPTLADLLTFCSLKMLWWGGECVSTSSEQIWVYYHILEILLALECSTPCVPLAAAHVRGTVPVWDFLCPIFACKYVGCYNDPLQNKGSDLHAKEMFANMVSQKKRAERSTGRRASLSFLKT